MLRLLCFGYIMLLIFVKGEKHWHTSQVALMKLYDLQKEHLTVINNYLELETRRLEELKNFLVERQDYRLTTKETYLKNHFNVINVMTRINGQLRKVEYLMNNSISIKALKQIDKHKNITENHIILASQSLRRQQKFYKIPASEMMIGRYENKTIGDPMNSCECYVILETCFKNDDFYGAVEWVIEVYNKWKNEGQPKCVNIEKLTSLFITSSFYTGFNSTSQTDLSGLCHPKDVDDLTSYFNLVKNDTLNYKSRVLEVWYFDNLEFNYVELCKRGQSKKILTKYSKCRYQSRNSHYRRLMPFKEEDVNREPDIKIYHDVLYDNEIKKLKIMASKKMVDALILKFNKPEGVLDESFRSCQLLLMKYKLGRKHFKSLNARIESFTKLSIGSAERYQVVNYGLGGHFIPHHDTFNDRKDYVTRRIGDRLMTVILYLTDVEYGGSTVFPRLNIASPAEKGAALVFYNLNISNGKIYNDTLHGACPILKGNKWITTKWMREAGQDLPYNWEKIATNRPQIDRRYYDWLFL